MVFTTSMRGDAYILPYNIGVHYIIRLCQLFVNT